MSRKRKRPQGHPARAPRPGASRPARAGVSPGRSRVEAASVPWLRRLGEGPRLLLPLLVGVGVLVALLVDSRWAALALLPALVLMGWLAYLTWPHLTTGRRALRVVVLALLVGWVVNRFVNG